MRFSVFSSGSWGSELALNGGHAGGEDAVIKVTGLKTAFGKQVIHDGLDLVVRSGEVLAIVGGSGTGKSVLLRTIIGLNKPVAGHVEVFGNDLRRLRPAARRQFERRWGVLFQDGALFGSLTVAQNIQVPMLESLDMPERLMNELTAVKIGAVGLPPEAGCKYPSELSGGMRKRAGLARALALDPEILFLDEPTAGLDPIGAAQFDQLIRRLQQSLHLTVVMVTHDLDSLFAICDRIAVLADQRVLLAGPLDHMLEQDHPWIREYFHGPRARAAGASRARAAT